MEISVEFIFVLIQIFANYVTYRMVKLFNEGKEKNRIIEIVTFVVFYFINNYMIMKIKVPALMFSIALLAIFVLSFNYISTLQIKIKASLYTMFIIVIAEAAVVLIAGADTTSTTGVSKDTLHLFFRHIPI